MSMPARRQAEFDTEFVRDVSEAVYRDRVGSDDITKMLDDPKRGPDYVRRTAGSYDTLTRAYLRTLKVTASLEIAR